jgi:hypothetical protein
VLSLNFSKSARRDCRFLLQSANDLGPARLSIIRLGIIRLGILMGRWQVEPLFGYKPTI